MIKNQWSYYLISSFLILFCFSFTFCFPSGAPPDSCDTLVPRHAGTYSTFDKNPYYVLASGDSYDTTNIFSDKPKSIKVDIYGAPFKGFMVTAVDTHTGKRVGKFNAVKGTTEIPPCSAVTQSDNRLKKHASLLWVPPKEEKGSVAFIATVVESFAHYYPGIVANVVHKPEHDTHYYEEVNMEHTIDDPLIRK